jgi:hypothetical protein
MGNLSSAFEKPTANGNNYSSAANPYGAMNFHQKVGNLFPNNSHTRWCCNFKGLSQQGDGRIFLQNLRASLFIDNKSNKPNLSRIHLAGQYL